MVTETQPVNLLGQSKRIVFFFLTTFFFFFIVLNLISFFNFASKQVTALAQTEFIPPIVESTPTTSPVSSPSATMTPTPVANFVVTSKENSVQIPLLEVEAPLVFTQNIQVKELTQDLNRGVVVYPGSALPGDKGEIIILGHSAPSFWPKIRYEWVFSRLNDLQAGDEILVNFENRQYRYQVTKKIFLDRGEEIKGSSNPDSPQLLYLLTCWPPGRDLRRLAVEAVLINPQPLTD